jgi:hypothetical protein
VIRNSLFVSATGLMLVILGLASRLDFLASSRKVLFLHCGRDMALYAVVLGVNLFSATLAINRKLLLKDTGRKLSHFDNQTQAGDSESPAPDVAETH